MARAAGHGEHAHLAEVTWCAPVLPDRHRAGGGIDVPLRAQGGSCSRPAAPTAARQPAGRRLRRGSWPARKPARKQVVDAGRGLSRHVHAAARHHDRERRPAGHPAGPALQFLGPAVGGGRVRADPGRVPADRGQPGGHVRPPPALPDRPGHLHLRLGAVRLRRQHADAPAVPRPAGSRRGDHVRGVPGLAGRCVPRQGPRRRVRRLGHRDRPGGRHRPAARRPADLGSVLAVHLLRERADRDRRPSSSP